MFGLLKSHLRLSGFRKVNWDAHGDVLLEWCWRMRFLGPDGLMRPEEGWRAEAFWAMADAFAVRYRNILVEDLGGADEMGISDVIQKGSAHSMLGWFNDMERKYRTCNEMPEWRCSRIALG